MPVEDTGPLSERAQTDDSLRVEREKADHALEEELAAIDEIADAVISRARARADAVLAAARTKMDRQPALTAASAQSPTIIKTERRLADEVLREERADADETLLDERAAHSARSLKTTNALESIHARVESRVAKVDHWKNSEQKQRWLATAFLDLEPRLRRIRNFRALPLLREALRRQIEGLKKSAA